MWNRRSWTSCLERLSTLVGFLRVIMSYALTHNQGGVRDKHSFEHNSWIALNNNTYTLCILPGRKVRGLTPAAN